MHRVSFGPFILDPGKRLLTRNGIEVTLPPKAFETLLVLVEAQGGALSKDALLHRVWPDVVVEESNLAQAVFTLRKALGDDPLHPRFIATVPRHGYRFVGEIRHERAGDPHQHRSAQPRVLVAIGAILLLAATASVYLVRGHVPARPRSVAVLPFRSNALPQDSRYLADGISDGIVARLAQLPSVVVIPRATVQQYNVESMPRDELARTLAAEVLLSGTVEHDADRLRVSVSLIQGSDGRRTWEQSFDIAPGQVFDLVGRIARGVASAVAVPDREVQALTRRPAPDPAAYDFYLRGRQAFGPAVGARRDESDRAEQWYEKALQIDSNLAEAYSGLAAVKFANYLMGWVGGTDMLDRSREMAEHALVLDPTLSDAYGTLIAIEWTLGRSEAGLRVGQRIERVGMSDLDSLRVRADAYHFGGVGDKAASLMARVVARDPGSRDAQHRLIRSLITARRYQDAIAGATRFFARFPEVGRTRQLAGLAYWSAGDLSAARRELETARRLAPDDMVIGINLARLLAVAGEEEEARRLAAADVRTMERMAQAFPDNILTHAHLAQQHGILQDRDGVRAQEALIMRAAGHNGSVVSQVGFAYANLGDLERAVDIWTQCLTDGFTAWDGAGDLTKRYPALSDLPRFREFRRALDAELARFARAY